MSKPFDASLKHLIEDYAADWVAALVPGETGAVAVIDADLSTVTASADKAIVVGHGGPSPWMLHLELQASRDADLHRRMLKYNALLHDRHGLPVYSVAVLLRPAASYPELTGRYDLRAPPNATEGAGGGSLSFAYGVWRVYETPAERLLSGGLGLLPLIGIADADRGELPELIAAAEGRFRTEANPTRAGELRVVTEVLMGMRYDEAFAQRICKGVFDMLDVFTESSVLRGPIERAEAKGERQGRVHAIRTMVLRLATKRFGPPDETAVATLEAVTDPERLERLADRVLDATGWADLLGTP
jgi:hypothetical protein